jgi:uncharacterized protein
MKRREFLSGSAAILSASSIALRQAQGAQPNQPPPTESTSSSPANRIPRVTSAGTLRGEMIYRELGSTGVQVSVIGMGGAHLGRPTVTEDEALRLIHAALDRGINFLDNSWDYNEDAARSGLEKLCRREVTGKKHL